MSLLARRRAMMENDVLWEWVPSKGLSNITLTASTGYTPNYELLSDCIRLKGPHATEYKQTNIVISDPPIMPDRFWIEVSIKNFPVNGVDTTNVGVYLRGNIVGNIIYANIYGARKDGEKTLKIRGANTVDQNWTSMPTEFKFKMLIDKNNNTATAFYPNGVTLTEAFGDSGYNPWIVSCESRSNGFFDVTKIVIRRAKA